MDTQSDVFTPAKLGAVTLRRAEAAPGSVCSAGMPSNNVMAAIYGHTRCVVTGAPDSLPVLG